MQVFVCVTGETKTSCELKTSNMRIFFVNALYNQVCIVFLC